MVLEKTLESPLDCKEILPGEGDQMNTASLKGTIHSAQHLLPGLQTAPPNWVIPAVKVWEGPGPWTSLLVLISA